VIGRTRAVVELVLAGVALAGAGTTWVHSHHTVRVAPITEGQPSTVSLVYDPQLLLLTLLLLITAGILAVVGTTRLRRARAAANATAQAVLPISGSTS
jgi:hypothetical protein